MATPRYDRQADGGVAPNTARVQPGVVTMASTGLGVARALDETGDQLNKLATVAYTKEQERDVLAVENAMNKYNELLLRHTSDPDSGIFNTNKMGLAEGVTGRFEGYAMQTQQEVANTLTNPRQRQAFLKTAQKGTLAYTKQVMGFESGQMSDYQKEVTATTLNVQRDAVLANPFSDDQMQSTYEMVAGALAAQMKGSSPESIKAATDDYMSKVESDRISAVADTDPIAAHQMAKDSAWLDGDVKQKIVGGTQSAVYKQQGRDIANEVFAMYGGPGEEYMGKEWILAQGYEPEVEAAAISAYNSRYGVAQARYSQEAKDLDVAQDAHMNGVLQIYERGGFRSQEEGDADLAAGRYTDADWRKENALRAGSVSSGQIESKLAKMPGWHQASLEQKERYRFDAAGTTPEIHANAVQFLSDELMAGTLDKKTIAAYRKSYQITAKEEQAFYDQLNNVKGALGPTIKYEQGKVDAILSTADGAFFSGLMSKPELKSKQAEYKGIVSAITAQDIPADEKKSLIQEATKNFLNGILDSTGLNQNAQEYSETDWANVNKERAEEGRPPISEPVRKARVGELPQLQREIDSTYKGPAPKVAPPAVQDVYSGTTGLPSGSGGAVNKYGTSVPGRGGQSSAYAPSGPVQTHDDMSVAMFGRKSGLYSDYDRPRDGGARQHGALDFAMPKGTPIRPMGIEGLVNPVVQKIDNTKTSSRKGAGNQVVITGKDVMGNDVTMKYFHMNNVGVRPGERVTPGMTIGTVGNSGTTIKGPGGDGSHLHYEVWVNGKRTRPLDYHQRLSAAVSGGRSAPAPSVAAAKKPNDKIVVNTPPKTAAQVATEAAQVKQTADTAKANNILFGAQSSKPLPSVAPTAGSVYYKPKASAAKTPVDTDGGV